MRILALDFGTKRIGVAVSDELLLTAQGRDTIYRNGIDQDIAAIVKLVGDENVSEIVVGLPLNMNGTYSQKTNETVEFADKLAKAVTVPIKMQDERLTTVQATNVLIAADMSRNKRKHLTDKLAAQVILQSYLDAKKRGT